MGTWDGWADDFQTQQERRDARYKRHADLRAAADAAYLDREERQALREARHTGTDEAAHHRNPYPGDDPLGDFSDDPIDVLGRRIVDQYTAQEDQKAEYVKQEQEEARRWLEEHRPQNVGPW